MHLDIFECSIKNNKIFMIIAIDYIYLITSFLTTYLKIYILILELTQSFNFIMFHVS